MTSDAPAVVDHATQSVYSDPGSWMGLFDEIDPTVETVSFMARNVVAHYRAQESELPESSREDISLRWVDSILATDQRRNSTPLAVERAVSDRVQGCCRDHTLLAVAALRHHGVPARSRAGFATYLSPTWNHDHVIVEAWLADRWRQFDPEFAEPLPRLADPTDIPHGRDSPFLTAAHVWLAHRAGSVDVTRFGVAEGMGIDGDWFVYGYVIAEVAHRFGDELLLWDTWGAMSGDLDRAPPEHLALVDEVARLLVRADEGDLDAERELLRRYREDDRLHPRSAHPERLPEWWPLRGRPRCTNNQADDVAGLTVHVTARVQALAEGNEILLTRTLLDAVAGSTLRVAERGTHELKGVPRTWELFALEG